MRGLLQRLFCDDFSAYARGHGLSADQHRAVRQIQTCRTAAQGSHIRICPNGDYVEHHYNSCKHRSCPRCGGFESARWADRQQAKALNCHYYHIVFTLPEELNVLWRFNRRSFVNLFFATAWQSLESLFRDVKWMGARPGALAVFQSWGETLNLHPHLHVLITAGGLDQHGQWKNARHNYLMPVAVLQKRFQGLFLNALRRGLYQKKTLVPPPTQSLDHWMAQCNRLALKRWHIQIQPPYRHPRGVLLYLAYYLRGGPISEHRLAWGENHNLRLTYKRPDEHQGRHLTLSRGEFMSRFLLHVPPRGLRMARTFGLFHPRARAAYEKARAYLKTEAAPAPTETAPRSRVADSYHLHITCPHCGAPLIMRRLARAPPLRLAA